MDSRDKIGGGYSKLVEDLAPKGVTLNIFKKMFTRGINCKLNFESIGEVNNIFEDSYLDNFSDNSFVVNVFIIDCSLKSESLDQIGILSSNANAKKGTSDLCEINLSAFDKLFVEGSLIEIISNTELLILSNISIGTLPLEQMTSAYLLSSLERQSGLNNLKLFSLINCLVNESFLNSENIMFVSTTNSIYNLPCFFNRLYKSFLSCSPSSKQSLSVILLFLNNSPSSCNASCFLINFGNRLFATSDQFIQLNSFNSDLISSGNVKVTDGIYNLPLFFNFSNSFNSESFSSIPCFNNSFQLTSGNFFLALLNSSGNDNVRVGILMYPYNLVYKHKSVNLYKYFDFWDWVIEASDNCVITSVTDVGGSYSKLLKDLVPKGVPRNIFLKMFTRGINFKLNFELIGGVNFNLIDRKFR